MGQAMSQEQSVDIHWDELSEGQLDAIERKIASKYMGELPWSAVAWGLGNFVMWLSLWPLVLMEILPLTLAFPLAVMNVTLAYLPSHEAQHGIIAREGRPLRWLNELVGHLSLIDPVCVGDDPAVGRLAEHLGQPHHRNHAAVDQVFEHHPRADRG